MGNSTAALTDFNRSLELKENDWTFYERGNAYRKLSQSNLAQADYQTAIQLVQQELQNKPDDFRNLFNLALYYLANNQSDLSKQTYQQGLKRGAKAHRIRIAVQDLNEFLKVFPGHAQASAFCRALQQQLERQFRA